jgi:hypothetical protein
VVNKNPQKKKKMCIKSRCEAERGIKGVSSCDFKAENRSITVYKVFKASKTVIPISAGD